MTSAYVVPYKLVILSPILPAGDQTSDRFDGDHLFPDDHGNCKRMAGLAET